MLFDSTLRRDLARSFGGTLVVILTIVLTMLLIRSLGEAAGGGVAPQDVVLLLGYVALGQLPLILSLSLFIAVVSTLTRMYRDSEMVIWFASGVTLWRFLRPVTRLTLPVVAVVAALSLLVLPWANQGTAKLRESYQKRSDLSRVAPGQFQTSADGRRVFFVDKDNADGGVGRNVFILSSQGEVESVTSARAGRIEPGADGERYLVLEDGARTDLDLTKSERLLSRFETYRVIAGERRLGALDNVPPKALDSVTLAQSGQPRLLGELAWRLGLVLAAALLPVLALALSAGNPRRGGSWTLLAALLAFVVYFNLINLGQAWVASSRTGLGAALGGLHGSVLVVALALLWWRDRGAAGLAWPRRRPAPN